MQGGYQLLDLSNVPLSKKTKTNYNLRDYIGKQIRVSGLEQIGYFDKTSVLTMNVVEVNGDIVLSTYFYNPLDSMNVRLSIIQYSTYEDFELYVSVYTFM